MTDTEKAMVDLVIAQVNEGIKEAKDGGIPIGRLSDGYHTFDELYDHRIENYLALCRLLAHTPSKHDSHPVWKSRLHSDGSSIEGWFVLGICYESGNQITYHLPDSRWEDCWFAKEITTAPEWDGHSSADVLQRLKNI